MREMTVRVSDWIYIKTAFLAFRGENNDVESRSFETNTRIFESRNKITSSRPILDFGKLDCTRSSRILKFQISRTVRTVEFRLCLIRLLKIRNFVSIQMREI